MIDTVSGKIVEFYDPRIQEIIEDACLKIISDTATTHFTFTAKPWIANKIYFT